MHLTKKHQQTKAYTTTLISVNPFLSQGDDTNLLSFSSPQLLGIKEVVHQKPPVNSIFHSCAALHFTWLPSKNESLLITKGPM